MTQSLPLLIATDANLLFAAATMLRSAHASLADGYEFEVYAYLDGVPEPELTQLTDFAEREFGRPLRVITDQSLAPEHQQLMNQLAEAMPKFPRALWARLFLPAVVTEGDRVVFADVDVAVIKDIAPLWEVPLDGNAVGAVRDPAPAPAEQLTSRYSQLQRYFNAGVMTIDLPRWRGDRVAERTIEWLLTEGKKSHFPDQDALNVILMAEDGTPLWTELDPVWNTIGDRRPLRWSDGTERPIVADEVRLRHFAGRFKPWNTERLLFKDVFDEHLAAQPFEVPEHMRKRARPSLIRRWARRVRHALR